MSFSPGQRLGPYTIVAPLGAGGMGEVWRATDTKLQRDVAIKVLPAEVAGDTARLARFQREAQLLAALNHPNIAAIHGLEEAAAADGIKGALATYKSLRQEHYGKGRYDFSERSLNSLAQRMLEQQRTDDARAALELNREHYPSSASVEAAFGTLFLSTGEKEKARSAFRRALELDPEQPAARWGMLQLDAPKAP